MTKAPNFTLLRGHHILISKRKVLVITDYQVIDDPYPNEIARIHQPFGDADILAGWFGITAWMAMANHHRSCSVSNGWGENFTGMNQALIQNPQRNNPMLIVQ